MIPLNKPTPLSLPYSFFIDIEKSLSNTILIRRGWTQPCIQLEPNRPPITYIFTHLLLTENNPLDLLMFPNHKNVPPPSWGARRFSRSKGYSQPPSYTTRNSLCNSKVFLLGLLIVPTNQHKYFSAYLVFSHTLSRKFPKRSLISHKCSKSSQLSYETLMFQALKKKIYLIGIGCTNKSIPLSLVSTIHCHT